MESRPKLEKGLDAKVFREYYYLKEELVEFCREENLQTTGGKIEITERIAHYLETGERLRSKKQSKASSYFGGYTRITLTTPIESNFKCTEQHRVFFKNIIGNGFKFNVAFQEWLKENSGKTYQDAVIAYKEIQESKKEKRTNIDRQFEYNTYIRDFFDDNKNKSLKQAIACWKYKRSLPGHNRYERDDLKILFEQCEI